MIQRAKWWTVGAAIFTVVNVGGAIFAAWQNELQHAAAHAVLAIVGVYGTMSLARRRNVASASTPSGTNEVDDRLSNLERSIDVVAIEIERVGEGQRFMTELLTKKADHRSETEAPR